MKMVMITVKAFLIVEMMKVVNKDTESGGGVMEEWTGMMVEIKSGEEKTRHVQRLATSKKLTSFVLSFVGNNELMR